MGKTFYEKGKKYNCYVTGKPYFRTSVTINGKVHQVYGDGEKDAKRKIEALKELAASGVDVNRRKEKFGALMQHWLFDIKRLDSGIKTSTFNNYVLLFNKHIKPYDIYDMNMSNVSRAAIQRYVNTMYERDGKSRAVIKHALSLLNNYCNWLVDEECLRKNPCRRISIPGDYKQNKKEIEVFSSEERARVLEYMLDSHYRYSVLIRLAFATGMRRGELLGLKWSDIEGGVIHVSRSVGTTAKADTDGLKDYKTALWEPKTPNAIRDIPITKETEQMLAEHRHQQKVYFLKNGLGTPEFLFTTEAGNIIRPSGLDESYRNMLKSAGVPHKKFHAIRHTFATEAIRCGVDVKDLSRLLGHSNVQTTYIYVQSDDESRRAAIEKMGAMM